VLHHIGTFSPLSFFLAAQNVLELHKLIFTVEAASRPRLFELSEYSFVASAVAPTQSA
jgi:hypothetical protein